MPGPATSLGPLWPDPTRAFSPARDGTRGRPPVAPGAIVAGGDLPAPAGIGRIEAELADLRLRCEESHAREKVLAERLARAEKAHTMATQFAHEREREVERDAAHVRAIDESLAWRFVQAVRGIFGRAW